MPKIKTTTARLGSDMTANRFWMDLLLHHIKDRKTVEKKAGGVFDLTHELLDIPGILAVEPNLVISKTTEKEFTGQDDDPKTDDQYTWHIERVRARTAREKFSVRGEGVRIANFVQDKQENQKLSIATPLRAASANISYNTKKNP